MPRRLALLIGNTKFCQEDVFPDLSAPEKDVETLSEVLEKYGHFEILARLVNQDADKIKTAIEDLYNQTGREDLTLLYYSGHGRRDTSGRLFLAASNTQTSHLLSTGVSASYIRDAQAASRTRHSVIILDCCYSGAFLPGEKGGSELALDQLKGEAAAILTSSGRVQPSYEGQDLNSIFTQALVDGIRSGEADQDGDGWVEIGELFDYIEQQVKQERPEQTPMLNLTARDSTIFIAETPPELQEARKRQQRLQVLFQKAQLAAESSDYGAAYDLLREIESQQPGYPGAAKLLDRVNESLQRADQQPSLPQDLQLAIASPLAGVRFGAVQDLKMMLYCGHPRLVQLAEQALEKLVNDDSHRVSFTASEALNTYRISTQPIPLEKPARIEPAQVGSQMAATVKPAPSMPKEQITAQPAVGEPPKTFVANELPGTVTTVRPEIILQPVKAQRIRLNLKWAVALGLLGLIAVICLSLVAVPGLAALLANPTPGDTPLPTMAVTLPVTEPPAQAASPVNTAALTLTSPPGVIEIVQPSLAAYTTIPVQHSACTQLGQHWVSPTDGMDLVCVPAGEFMMGSDAAYARDNAKPQHTVTLDAFWIDKTEVTNRMFQQFVNSTGYQTDAEKSGTGTVYDLLSMTWNDMAGVNWQHPRDPSGNIQGLDSHPVVQVSWNDASAYCVWAGKRLPTESEWEKAARGTDGRKYPWGNQAPSGSLLNFADRSLGVNWAANLTSDGYKYTAPVGSYPAGASPYGALDMSGNVWEWVQDWYYKNAYSVLDTYNPIGKAPGTNGDARVLRGGSWDYRSELGSKIYNFVSVTYREYKAPDTRLDMIGFRCAAGPVQ